VNVLMPQLSDAVGSVQLTTAPHLPRSLALTMFCGAVHIVGFCVSATVNVTEAVFEQPVEVCVFVRVYVVVLLGDAIGFDWLSYRGLLPASMSRYNQTETTHRSQLSRRRRSSDHRPLRRSA